MTEQKPWPFGLNPTRIVLLAMGAFILLITISMMMGGLGSYQALKDASKAAVEPSAEQVSVE